MEIVAGMDIHDRFCVIHATNAKAGRTKRSEQDFLDEVNRLFGKVRTEKEALAKFVRHLDGHKAYYLIENSTIAHKVYWIMRGLGCEIFVAQSHDLTNITDSVTKNDENDAYELAHYMRRRLLGEKEFALCMMAPPEWMAKKELIRAVYKDKQELSNIKKAVRARVKVMGADMRFFKDVSCPSSLRDLKETRDPYLCYQARRMKDALSRIREGEKIIGYLFRNDEDYQLILSITGIGVPLAAYLKTIILDIDRFETKDRLEAYFGLVPRQDSSAERDPSRPTTHRGDGLAREYLCYAAMAHVIHEPGSHITAMYNRLMKNKPYKKVKVACAREILDVVWSVLRHRRPYTTDKEILQKARGYAEQVEEEEIEED